MFQRHIAITLRTLWRDRGYTFINILGLSVGIACGIVVTLYIEDELSFDRMHAKSDRIYRAVERQRSTEKGERLIGSVMGPVAPALQSQLPQVEQTTRLLTRQSVGRLAIGSVPNRVYDGTFLFAEPSFFELFDFHLISGDRATALMEPRSVVLTETEARKHFGSADAVGKQLEVERFDRMLVTGVIQDPPPNSHLTFSMLFSMSSVLSHPGWLTWSNSRQSDGFITYVLLKEGVTHEEVQPWVATIAASLADTQAASIRSFVLQSLSDVHFGSATIEFDLNSGKSERSLLFIFGSVGLFIILIACVNYTNLSTARSMRRAREVGIRKVSGAGKGQIFRQFLGESFVLSGVAFLLALLIQELMLPSFNQIAGKALSLQLPEHAALMGILVLLVGLIATVSGIYPAIIMAQFRPVTVLKGGARSLRGAGFLRKGLVAFQFVLSVGMIISTIVVSRQLGFVMGTDLGFKRSDMVVVDINSGSSRGSFRSIKSEFLKVPGVTHVSTTSRVPGEWKNIPEVEVLLLDGSMSSPVTMTYFAVDEDFLETFRIGLVAGRNFTQDLRTDSTAVLLNERAAELLGGIDVLGTEILLPSEVSAGQRSELGMRVRVAGIVKNYHFRSFFEPIGPAVFGYWSNPVQAIDYFTVSIEGRSPGEIIPALRAVAETYDPAHPFEYNLLDDRWADFYAAEERASNVFTLASLISIVISCLGLFGLAAYATEQRTKEVGIRKVLGASSSGIVALMSREFILLVLIGNAIAWPASYVVMRQWLDNFAYRTELGLDVFLLAGGVSVLIAFFSVSYRALRAALANPVESLRYE